jgi:hypothetical protein
VGGLTGPDATSQGRELFAVSLLVALAVGVVRHRLDGPLSTASVSPVLRRWAVVVGVLALAGLVIAENPVERWDSFKEPPKRAEALPVSGNFTNDNGSGRYQFWDAAIDGFGHEPLHGIGAGQFGTWWNRHGSIHFIVLDAHSLLFETAAELGIVGLALLLVFLGTPIRSGWNRRAGPSGVEAAALLALLTAALLSALIDWMWELAAVFGPAVVAAALLTGRATDESADPGPQEPPNRPLALGLATVAVAWAALWCSGDLLLTQIKLDESHSAAADGNLVAAAESADDATALAPWAAEPRMQLGLVQELSGELSLARRSLGEAAHRAPHDWRIWFLLGRVEGKSGHPEAARAALERALRESPRSPFLRRAVRASPG